MSRKLYLECLSGISGDMFVASLLDLGADAKLLESALHSLGLPGFEAEITRVSKNGLDACDFHVVLDKEHENYDHDMEYLHGEEHMHHVHSHGEENMYTHNHENIHVHHHENVHADSHEASHGNGSGDGAVHMHKHAHEHRGLADILPIIDSAKMSDRAKETAGRIFRILAQAEAKAHGVSAEEVHFHEVGAVDSIADIVAAAVCLDSLAIEEVIVPALHEGTGFIRCQHGLIPVPVPAVAAIAQEHGLVLHIDNIEGEFVTPTGAAIAAAIKTHGRLPENFTILKTGIGAGKRNYERPSILRAMLIEETEPKKDYIYRLESNIDDCTGEALGYVMERLLDAGARDVSYTPIFMKKNRPAYQLNVICKEEDIKRLEEIIFMETTTIGIRRQKLERSILKRESKAVQTSLGEAWVKVCMLPSGKRVYPEYGSVAALCRKSGLAWQDVYQLVVREAAIEQGKKSKGVQDVTAEDAYNKKKQALFAAMQEYIKEDIAIAFSGGVDSSLLLKVACDVAGKNGSRIYAITAHTELHSQSDLEVAKKVAEETGAFHEILHIDEMEEAGIEMNPLNRCYLCKKLLFTRMKEKAVQLGAAMMIEGTNADDLGMYRPGLQAIKELGIISPLAEAGLTKAEVRALADEYGISVAGRPANPCMATRFPYGVRLTKADLEKAEKGEAYIKALGVYNVRLRVQDHAARIEVDPDYFEQILKNRVSIIKHLKKLGYQYISLDMEGFRSGSMDEVHHAVP